MPWRHLVLGTRCSWLHGDARGFRSRDKRIESCGDYKVPPPPDEHAGLRRYHEQRSGDPVELDINLRVIVCREFVLKMRSMGIRIIACSVGEKHLHGLSEISGNYSEMKKVVGRAKQKASHAIREFLPGSIWCEGGSYKIINDLDHLKNSYEYIRTRQDAGSIVWSHNDKEDWITNPSLGIILMGPNKIQQRIFEFPQAGV
jgi:hypothetical protein